MLIVNFFFWRYCQLLAEKLEDKETEKLRQKFDYILAVIYGPIIPAGFQADVKQSLILDLRAGLDTVWHNFRHNTRNEIRRIEKDSRASFVNLDTDIDKVYAIYSKFERARNWMPVLRREIKNSLIFSAYYNNKLIAGVICFTQGDIVRVSKIFSVRHNDADGVTKSIIGQATRKLVWEICKYAHSLGYRYFDLGGVDFTNPAKIGISQFKQSFGGSVMPVYISRCGRKSFFLVKKLLRYFGKDIV